MRLKIGDGGRIVDLSVSDSVVVVVLLLIAGGGSAAIPLVLHLLHLQ